LTFCAGLLAFLVLATLLSAGPLDPPTGPVTSTGPNMIFSLDPPVVITQSGTYRVVKDIQVTTSTAVGITINADGVILDLEGHELRYTAPGGGTCISISGRSVTVRNGTITGWRDGLQGDSEVTIDHVNFFTNGTGTGAGSSVTLGNNSRLLNCVFKSNEGGPALGDRAIVTECVLHAAAGRGLVVGNHSVVDRCSTALNQFAEIKTGEWAVVTGCTVQVNALKSAGEIGIDAAKGSLIEGCLVELGAAAASGTGIRLGDNCTARRCRVGTSGTFAGPGGISVSSKCTVEQCEITSTNFNFQSLLVQGTGNVIAGNTLVGATVGISVQGPGNLLTGNRVSGATTPFQIAAGNAYGAILNVAGGGAITGADPTANLVY
jgi:parallel beta-helix repeat protein